MSGRQCAKASIDCVGYREEMDAESAEIGGQVAGSGYRAEMNSTVDLIIAGYYTEDAVESFIELQQGQEASWKNYLLQNRGDVSQFNRLQRRQLAEWLEWRDTVGLNPDSFKDS